MKIKQFEIWLANLNPAKGTEPGKVRPVVIVQTDLLNESHPSVIICPLTTNVLPESEILRVHLDKGQLEVVSDILVDQIRAIDKKRLISKLGELTRIQADRLGENIKLILDL
jgi:mRNA interferase MazF